MSLSNLFSSYSGMDELRNRYGIIYKPNTNEFINLKQQDEIQNLRMEINRLMNEASIDINAEKIKERRSLDSIIAHFYNRK